jgi:hypothetical protein
MRPSYLREIVESAVTRNRSECWPWPGKIGRFGYGAHLRVYQKLVGPVPSGLELDHLCRNRACVNPFHLEPVTRLENQRRGNTLTSANLAKTHCPRGHPYDETNTVLGVRTASGRHRICKICRNALQIDRQRRYFERKKGRPLGPHNGTKTHCSNGHPFTEDNIIWRKYKYGLARVCKECLRISSKRIRDKHRAQKLSHPS